MSDLAELQAKLVKELNAYLEMPTRAVEEAVVNVTADWIVKILQRPRGYTIWMKADD